VPIDSQAVLGSAITSISLCIPIDSQMEKLFLKQRDVFSYICDILGFCNFSSFAVTCKSFNAAIEVRRDQQAAWPFTARKPNVRTQDGKESEQATPNPIIVTDAFSVSRFYSPYSNYGSATPLYPSTVRMCGSSKLEFYKPPSIDETENFSLPGGAEMISTQTQGLVGRSKYRFACVGVGLGMGQNDNYIGMLQFHILFSFSFYFFLFLFCYSVSQF
jgi:hypothetical protein